MYQNKVDTFVMSKSKYFTESDITVIREMLVNADDALWGQISTLQFKDPTTMLIISFLGGGLGIDRFMIGDTGLGLGKLLTCGGFGGLSFRVVSRALSQPQVAGQVIYLLLLIRLMFVGLYGTAWLLSLFLFFSSFGLMALSG